MRMSDGVELALTRWEAVSPKGILCGLHGLGEHAARYEHVAQAWRERGFSFRMLDLRGHGRSPGKRGDTPYAAAMQDSIELLASAAQEGLPVFLFGHSFGGGLALHLMVTQPLPIAAGIVTSPWLRIHRPIKGPTLAALTVLSRIAPHMTMANGIDASGLSHDRDLCERYGQDPLVHDRVSTNMAYGAHRAGEHSLVNAGDLCAPLLLLHGGADPICDAAASRAFARGAGLKCVHHEYEGMLHELHNEPVWEDVFQREAAFAEGI